MGRPKLLVRIVVGGVAAVYTLLLLSADLQLDSLSKRIIVLLPAVGVAALWLWDVVLWKLPIVHGVTKRPLIHGTWKVLITPHAESHIPKGGNWGPIEGFIIVRQSFWSLDISLFTNGSASDTVNSSWINNGVSRPQGLAFSYRNTPNMAELPRNEVSYGANTFDIRSLIPKKMNGVYFTDHYTKGSIVATFVKRTVSYDSYEDMVDSNG